jgi:hypothetical protein
MHRIVFALTTALVAAALPPSTAAAHEQLPRSLARLSPADFASRVQSADDPLAGAVVLSTRQGYARSRAIQGAHANDVHLRASVDKRSGRVRWQVWHDLMYVGSRKDLHAVRYRSGGTTQSVTPFTVDHWLDQCPPTDAPGQCNHNARIGFELPETTVREIAAHYRAGARVPWSFQFKDIDGRDVTGGLAPAEAAGLVAAIDARADGRSAPLS